MSTVIKIDNVDVTDKFNAFDLQITKNKRTYNNVRGVLHSTEFTIEEGTEITVTIDGNLEFGGLIQNVKNIPTTVINKYYIYATSYEQLNDRRTITTYYIDKDAGDIVTDLISSVLTSEGITIGNIDTGAKITHVSNAISMKDFLDDLALTSGYVWFIDNDKKLYFQEDYNYTSGTFPSDYETVEVGRTLVGYANKVFCLGSDGIVAFSQSNSEITKMATRFGSGVYGTIVRDSNADTETKAQDVADVELSKRAFDKKYAVIKTRDRLVEGTIYTNLTLAYTDIDTEDYAIDEVVINCNVSNFTYKATLQPYNTLILSKVSSWQDKFRQFMNASSVSSNVSTSNGVPWQTNEETAIALTAATTHTETFTFLNENTSYSILTVDAEIDTTTDAKVDIEVRLDSVVQYARRVHINADVDTLNLTTSLEEVESNTHTVEIDITSSVTGTVNDFKFDCQQFINKTVVLPAPELVDAYIEF